MKKQYLLMGVIFLFSISYIVAQDIRFYGKIDSSINLTDTCTFNGFPCDNSFVCRINVEDPNQNIIIINDSMNKNQSVYNYTLNASYTSSIGRYKANIYCGNTTNSGSDEFFFELNALGQEFNLSKSIMFIGLLAILIFLFVVSLISYSHLPPRKVKDQEGRILSLNQLGYLRPVVLLFAWAMLLAILWTSANMAIGFVGTQLFGKLLFTIWEVLMWMNIPLIFIWIIWIFVSIYQDNEFKRMLERGIDSYESP